MALSFLGNVTDVIQCLGPLMSGFVLALLWIEANPYILSGCLRCKGFFYFPLENWEIKEMSWRAKQIDVKGCYALDNSLQIYNI